MIKRLVPLLLLVCLLMGCVKQPAETVPDTEPTFAETEPTQAYIPQDVELQAVNTHGFRKCKEKPAVSVIDHRTAAFLTGEYAVSGFSGKCTRIQLVDLYSDTLICEVLLDGTYTPMGHFTLPGYLAITAESGDVLVLDMNLQDVLRFRPEDSTGILTGDLGKYYYIWGSELWCQDVSTGDVMPVSRESDLTFQEILGYDTGENVLLLSAYAGTYAADLCVAALKLDTMEYALLYQGVSGGAVAENGVLLELDHQEMFCCDLLYGDWGDSELKSLPGFLVNNVDFAGWHIPGSDYVCRFTYDEAQKVDIVEFELFRLGETVAVTSLQEELKGAKITQILSLPDGNLLAMEISSRGYRTYLICPDQLDFTEVTPEMAPGMAMVDTEIVGNGVRQDLWELPAQLMEVRQQADDLEEKYGVTILISGQCTDALKTSGMEIVTTDLAGLRDEAAAIEAALNDLDAMLALYPEDFFFQFQDNAGERGLLVLLVEDFEDEMDIIGLTYEMGKWYPIAVDITSGQVASTICHEIWHATEIRINDLSKTALDLAAWENCNPEGHKYSGNMTPTYIKDTRYTYLLGVAGESVHFVDPYAKVNAREDRARLMEYVMYMEMDAKMMLEHPAMAAKLQILCDAIRQVFDTQHWTEVHWERFF